MRSALGFTGLITLLVLRTVSAQQPVGPAAAPAAQAPPSEMVVTAAEVEVRSGPNKERYYPTGKLFKGQRVQVVKEENGWIAIRPPAGSISWINADKVLRDPTTQIAAVIGQDPVAVRPGGLVKGLPPVELTKVQPGTLVVVVGKPEVKDSGTWLPIQPVPKEVRYLPAEALQAAQGGFVAAQPAINLSPAQIKVDADQKVAAGNVQQAIQLYQQLLAQPNADSEQRLWAQNRLASLTGGASTAGTSPVVGASPATMTTTQQDAPRWSVWARLRRTAFEKDGQPMFVLEDNRGQVLLYVTTGSGFTLRDYIGKTVALYGTITYRNDGYVRTHYMNATHVATLPN